MYIKIGEVSGGGGVHVQIVGKAGLKETGGWGGGGGGGKEVKGVRESQNKGGET